MTAGRLLASLVLAGTLFWGGGTFVWTGGTIGGDHAAPAGDTGAPRARGGRLFVFSPVVSD